MYIRIIALHTTTHCTLRCKKCLYSFPEFSPKHHSDYNTITRALKKTFEIVSNIDELRIAGAEAFLHPNIKDILLDISNYKSQFNFLSIATNGSYVPESSIFETIAELPYTVLLRVDNYGSLSKELDNLVLTAKEHGITPEVRCYTGDEQAFGGWLDVGNYKQKNYTESELNDVFKRCKMILSDGGIESSIDCSVVWEDKLYLCPYIVSGIKLGKFPESERDFIDLFDDMETIAKKREKIALGKETPLTGCSYCNGYDPEKTPRIPAAEQL
jgi:hypothetical protein